MANENSINRKSGRNYLTVLKMGHTIFIIFCDSDDIFYLSSPVICGTLHFLLLLVCARTAREWCFVVFVSPFRSVNEAKPWLHMEMWKNFSLLPSCRTRNVYTQNWNEMLIYRPEYMNIMLTRSTCWKYPNWIYRKLCALFDRPHQMNFIISTGKMIIREFYQFGILCNFNRKMWSIVINCNQNIQ